MVIRVRPGTEGLYGLFVWFVAILHMGVYAGSAFSMAICLITFGISPSTISLEYSSIGLITVGIQPYTDVSLEYSFILSLFITSFIVPQPVGLWLIVF